MKHANSSPDILVRTPQPLRPRKSHYVLAQRCQPGTDAKALTIKHLVISHPPIQLCQAYLLRCAHSSNLPQQQGRRPKHWSSQGHTWETVQAAIG